MLSQGAESHVQLRRRATVIDPDVGSAALAVDHDADLTPGAGPVSRQLRIQLTLILGSPRGFGLLRPRIPAFLPCPGKTGLAEAAIPEDEVGSELAIAGNRSLDGVALPGALGPQVFTVQMSSCGNELGFSHLR